MASAAATVVAVALARRLTTSAGRWAAAWALPAAVFCLAGAAVEQDLWRVERHWPAYVARLQAGGEQALRREVERSATEASAVARAALGARDDAVGAFADLAASLPERPGVGVVLYRGERPVAWAGELRVDPGTPPRPLTVAFTPFYLVLRAQAANRDARAVATLLLSAVPPADRIARALDESIAATSGVRGFEFEPPGGRLDPGTFPVVVAGDTLFVARAVAPTPEAVRVRVVERARLVGAATLLVAYICFLLALWRRGAALRQRLLALAIAAVLIALAPLNELSNATQIFDPSFYFAALGGPFTASVGALGISGAIALVALFAVLRSPARLPRWLALIGAMAVAGVAPYLLRALARGIALPAWGVTTRLWIAWEVTIFLAGVSLLLAGASLGRPALGGPRGLPPWVAPAIAALAAVLAPVLWEAPGRWPRVYPLLWVVAIAAVALTRRHRAVVLTAAAVAGFGAATVVWGAVARKRVELAQRDVAALGVPDAYARALLERLADDLIVDAPPTSRAALLRRYAESDLAAAGYTAALVRWTAAGRPADSLLLAPQGASEAELRAATAGARTDGAASGTAAGGWAVRQIIGPAGVQLVLAVAHPDGSATTATVAPRTRLVPDDPFAALLGLSGPAAAEPPYALALLAGAGTSVPASEQGRWKRLGDELHSDWTVETSAGPARAHVEVDLRSVGAVLQRGTLVVLLDVVLVMALWMLTALAEGGKRRWMARRWTGWIRSYRARLTVALFGFFVVPAALFVTWSYRRLQSDDQQARELLVGEALRVASSSGLTARRFEESEGDLTAASAQVRAPLLLYADGVLEAGSDPLYEQLATLGRFLAPAVRLSLGGEEEVTASHVTEVGDLPVLVGYRAAGVAAASGAGAAEWFVLAAPARTSELALDRRRRDLGILVLLSTAVGALAALWLSGVAARELARPINALRDAALAIAGGAREVSLGTAAPPSEFEPVFGAYRRMAADLSASQTLLEAAQRRTEAVLRNVASGVVAVDPDGVVLLANPRAEALCGGEVSGGAPLACAAAPALLGRVHAFVAGPADDEEFDLDVDGRQLHARLTRLERGGAVLTLDDVTELARAQRVLAWGEMARQVAHEIKNPLTPIRLGVQHLRRARADGRGDFDRILDQNVTRILAEIDRLDEIARAFSRYGTAPEERQPGAPVDVAAVVSDVVALERLGEGTVTWQVSGADRPAVAQARADELREVLLNVLENARLAGARCVAVELVREPTEVRIDVRDDGHGMPPEVLARAFEPHFSTRTSGSGLGLAISRRMVEGWGGSMTVESQPGRGTLLRIGLAAA